LSDFRSTAYSDSINDLPLLQAVNVAVAVYPDLWLLDKAKGESREVILLR
jgi:phosphoserine phosphatase